MLLGTCVCFHCRSISLIIWSSSKLPLKQNQNSRYTGTSSLESSTVFEVRDNSPAGNRKRKNNGQGANLTLMNIPVLVWHLAWEPEAHQLSSAAAIPQRQVI